MSSMSLFPEELIETVLSYCLDSPSSSRLTPWHSHSRSRLSILLVCRLFYRIGTPLFYHTISVQSASQLQRLLTGALRPNPSLASFVRRIVLPGIWEGAGEFLYRCGPNLKVLDVTLDYVLNTQGHDHETEEFGNGLHELKALTHIVVRKPNNVYLTRPKLQSVLSAMARAMQNWNELEYVDLAFRLSDDSGGTAALLTMLPIPVPIHRPRSAKLPGPVTQLTQVLSSRPKLHTFSTLLPNVWNENILRVSQNPALERIILIDFAGDVKDETMLGSGSGIAGIGHFFAQARRHTRLSELIRSGTAHSSITRSRAQTMTSLSHLGCTPGYSISSPLSSSSSAPSSRPQEISHGGVVVSSSVRCSWQGSHSWEYYPPSNTPGLMTSSLSRVRPLSTSAP